MNLGAFFKWEMELKIKRQSVSLLSHICLDAARLFSVPQPGGTA